MPKVNEELNIPNSLISTSDEELIELATELREYTDRMGTSFDPMLSKLVCDELKRRKYIILDTGDFLVEKEHQANEHIERHPLHKIDKVEHDHIV
jgi:hypothetical protein